MEAIIKAPYRCFTWQIYIAKKNKERKGKSNNVQRILRTQIHIMAAELFHLLTFSFATEIHRSLLPLLLVGVSAQYLSHKPLIPLFLPLPKGFPFWVAKLSKLSCRRRRVRVKLALKVPAFARRLYLL